MSQILHTLPHLPANFDDGDVDSEASDDSNDSDGSDDFGEFLDDNDVGDEAEASPDNEASVKANNNAGDVKTATTRVAPERSEIPSEIIWISLSTVS